MNKNRCGFAEPDQFKSCRCRATRLLNTTSVTPPNERWQKESFVVLQKARPQIFSFRLLGPFPRISCGGRIGL